MAMMQMQSHTTPVMRSKQMLAVMQLLPLTHGTDEDAYSESLCQRGFSGPSLFPTLLMIEVMGSVVLVSRSTLRPSEDWTPEPSRMPILCLL